MQYAKLLVLLLILCFSGCNCDKKQAEVEKTDACITADESNEEETAQAEEYDEQDEEEPRFLDGDVLMQHLAGKLPEVIVDITKSKYSHCGIVVNRDGEPCVLEAIGPVVCHTPLDEWINQGIGSHYTHLRPKGLSSEKIAKAIAEAEKLIGKPYDSQYELDEEKIYCSELIYKAFLRGANVEIGKKEKLGDLDWKQHELFIRYMAGGSLPLDRVMVTPESVAKSPRLELIQTTFPPDH